MIARAGKPVARLSATEPLRREFGFLDIGDIPDDFFAPLSEEELKDWEG